MYTNKKKTIFFSWKTFIQRASNVTKWNTYIIRLQYTCVQKISDMESVWWEKKKKKLRGKFARNVFCVIHVKQTVLLLGLRHSVAIREVIGGIMVHRIHRRFDFKLNVNETEKNYRTVIILYSHDDDDD